MSGKVVETIRSPKPVLYSTINTVKQTGNTFLHALVINGDLLSWDITDIVVPDRPSSTPKRTPSKKTALMIQEGDTDLTAEIAINADSSKMYVISSTGHVAVLDPRDLKPLSTVNLGSALSLSGSHFDDYGNFNVLNSDLEKIIKLNQNGEIDCTVKRTVSHKYINASLGGTKLLYKSGSDEFQVFDGLTDSCVLTKTLKHKSDAVIIDELAITPDGCYVVVACNRNVMLVRVRDGRLLANVTLYDSIWSIFITPDSWYVLMGMPDRRMFVLLIADPEESSHTERVKINRENNLGLDEEKSKALVEIAVREEDSSDEDYASPKAKLNTVTLLDMDRDGIGRTLSRNASSMTRALSRARTTMDNEDMDPEEGGPENERLTIVTPQLCNLQ